MTARRQDGFTLIEVLIAVVLSSVIAGVTLAALMTSLNASSATTGQVSDSTDAGLISSYLFRDAQSAGAVDPRTATIDPTLGVSTIDSPEGWSGCTQSTPLVVRFSWVEQPSQTSPVTVVATYSLDDTGQLNRRVCRNGTTIDLTLGRSVASATVVCTPDPTCLAQPTSVSLSVTGKDSRAPFEYTLTAALRVEPQAPPTASNSATVPLLVLGPRAGTSPCPTLALPSTGVITVVGSALISSTCGSDAISGDTTRLQPTGVTSTRVGVTDPREGREPPAGVCDFRASNPVIGTSTGPTSNTVYHQPVTTTGSVVFQAGRHVFCAGLTFGAGSRVSGSGVLLYVADGSMFVDRLATLDLSPATTGTYAGLLAWIATTEPVVLEAGPEVSSWRGTIYAPTSSVILASENAINVGGLITERLTISGDGAARIGQPIPHLTVLPATLPPGEVGVAYAIGLTSSGGTAPSTWAAVGLPPGLTLAPTTGEITGSPTTSGDFRVVVTTFDASAAATSIEHTVSVVAAVSIGSPSTLPIGVVGALYPATPFVPAGGAAPFVWSSTGLPAGIRLDPATGVLGGIPTQVGEFTPTITVTDSRGGAVTRGLTLTIVAPLSITPTSPPATGVVGVALTATTTATSGGAAPYTYTASGLPSGLAIEAATGSIVGTPTASGTSEVTIVVADSTGSSASAAVTITIASPDGVPAGCPIAPTGWRGEYFANPNVAGKAKLCRDDALVDFDWAYGAPAPGLKEDHFSVRWTRTQTFAAGVYTFSIGSDDGSRLYVDGALVFDRWVDQGYPATVPTVVVPLKAGSHTIVLEYYERGGAARATLSWYEGGPPLPVSCSVTAVGWLGEYYSNLSLAGAPVLCRDDASVNFDWQYGYPATGLPTDVFSVRWTRMQYFAAGNYTFTLGTDDGGRLYIDGVLVIDRWNDQAYPAPEPSSKLKLTAGSHKIVVEYYERGGAARAQLRWS